MRLKLLVAAVADPNLQVERNTASRSPQAVERGERIDFDQIASSSGSLTDYLRDQLYVAGLTHRQLLAGEALIEQLQQERTTSDDEISVPQFKEYALNLIDQIFTTSK